ncbi:hypothetical protein AB4565_14980, partial [Vibrio breoganii]
SLWKWSSVNIALAFFVKLLALNHPRSSIKDFEDDGDGNLDITKVANLWLAACGLRLAAKN